MAPPLGSCKRRQHISADSTQSVANISQHSKKFASNMESAENNENNTDNNENSKPIKQTLFDETKITVYEVKRHHRTRGRTRGHHHKSHHHRVHPRRSLSQGATPRSKNPHPLLIRQPLAPQRRLSVSKLKLNANYSGYQKSTLFCLSIVSFTSMLSMSLIAPFFPLEASNKGMRETIYGFVFSVYALVIMIFSPIAGKLIPIIGPNFMLISGVFVAGVANVLFGVLDKIDDLPTFTAYCFIVRIFEALGAASFSTASYTIIMQVFPDNIGTAFGFIETCVGLGMSLGPAIGGGLYGLGGYSLPFFVLGGLMIATIPLCLYVIKPIEFVTPIKTDSSASYLKLISIPQVLVVGIVVVLVSQTISFLDPTVEPHFRDLNISPEYVSIVFLLLSAAYTVFSPIVGWFSGYFDIRQTDLQTCVGLGMSLGPAIGGGLYGLGGYSLPFFVLGGLMIATIPLCLYVIKPIEFVIPIQKDSSASYLKLISIPQVLVVGIVVVLVSQTISFLDPTVEPHFRDLNISPEYVSIVFLLLSAAYTVFSPIVGWFSGYFDNKFPIMALGMFLTSVGLLLMGPSFLIPLEPSLLISVGAMGLIGVAYAIAFIPTFESILDIALYDTL
ncbi:unnamed protein product [Oppiella nova]|uniref:Major facilitator superfamily (MFS) profile domain-containing protein n=1 Tax=Oppiella nova TaxID=334625 RepID=A0A7R9QDT6_9ACAR|nr:unnamed protein product [Oppiella nova]CAG2163322.1 unnamed protein product [Oppiella nova]